jgi:hypothetical protein
VNPPTVQGHQVGEREARGAKRISRLAARPSDADGERDEGQTEGERQKEHIDPEPALQEASWTSRGSGGDSTFSVALELTVPSGGFKSE